MWHQFYPLIYHLTLFIICGFISTFFNTTLAQAWAFVFILYWIACSIANIIIQLSWALLFLLRNIFWLVINLLFGGIKLTVGLTIRLCDSLTPATRT